MYTCISKVKTKAAMCTFQYLQLLSRMFPKENGNTITTATRGKNAKRKGVCFEEVATGASIT